MSESQAPAPEPDTPRSNNAELFLLSAHEEAALRQRKLQDAAQRKDAFQQMVCGLKYLHEDMALEVPLFGGQRLSRLSATGTRIRPQTLCLWAFWVCLLLAACRPFWPPPARCCWPA